jgi:hypothetical protein
MRQEVARSIALGISATYVEHMCGEQPKAWTGLKGLDPNAIHNFRKPLRLAVDRGNTEIDEIHLTDPRLNAGLIVRGDIGNFNCKRL